MADRLHVDVYYSTWALCRFFDSVPLAPARFNGGGSKTDNNVQGRDGKGKPSRDRAPIFAGPAGRDIPGRRDQQGLDSLDPVTGQKDTGAAYRRAPLNLMDYGQETRNRNLGNPDTLNLDIGPRGYDILTGEGLIKDAGRLLAPVLKRPRVIVVTDSNVAPLWLDSLMAGLSDADIRAEAITVPAGERTKRFSRLEDLCERILGLRAERKTTLIALGGGVIGDLTGFAAAVTLRGMDFVQIPTTLLAQVDSSVGGKTGINTKHGKNLVGAFHQPRMVLADVDALETLDKRELLAGYAEVVKYGLINDRDFFAWLETNGEALVAGDRGLRAKAIVHCCRAKADVVTRDEREEGFRGLLNLGHTFGHALEAECGYGDKLLHGEAVAIGMAMAFDLSVALGLCPAADAGAVRNHIGAVGLPADFRGLRDASWSAEKLIAHMSRDKKVVDGKIAFVLTRGVGKAFLSDRVSPDALRSLIDEYLNA